MNLITPDVIENASKLYMTEEQWQRIGEERGWIFKHAHVTNVSSTVQHVIDGQTMFVFPEDTMQTITVSQKEDK